MTAVSCGQCGQQRPAEFQILGPLEDEGMLRRPPRSPRQSGALAYMLPWLSRGYPQGMPSFSDAGELTAWSRPHGLTAGIPVNRPPSSLGVADLTRRMWSLDGHDRAVRQGGVAPRAYELLAIRFAHLKHSIRRALPDSTRHQPGPLIQSTTRVHLECLEQAAEQVDVGLRPQRAEQGLDLLPQLEPDDISSDRIHLQRALLWEVRRGNMSFPSPGSMLSWARLTATGAFCRTTHRCHRSCPGWLPPRPCSRRLRGHSLPAHWRLAGPCRCTDPSWPPRHDWLA